MEFPTFQSQDEIPEPFRELYERQDDGTFAVPVQKPGDGAQGAADLKSALEDERRKRDAAEKSQKKLIEELQELRDKRKAEEAGITDDKLKQIRADVRKELEDEYGQKIEAGQAALQENRELKLDNRVRAMAADNGVRADRLDHWWRQHRDQFELTDDGEPYVKDHPGKDVKRFIADDLKKVLPEFYQGTKADGGGAGGGHAPGAAAGDLSFDDVLKNPGRAITASNEAAAGAK